MKMSITLIFVGQILDDFIKIMDRKWIEDLFLAVGVVGDVAECVMGYFVSFFMDSIKFFLSLLVGSIFFIFIIITYSNVWNHS